MPTQKEIWDSWKAPKTLEEKVNLFFELIDKTELSNNDVRFKPNRMTISSCRVWDTHRLRRLIPSMRRQAKARVKAKKAIIE